VDIVLRATFAFTLILLVTRTIGRRELAGLEPFDVILLVVIGDMIQQGVTQNDVSVTGMALVVVTLAVLTLAISWAGFRVPTLQRVLDGVPTVLVEDGVIIERNLRRERMTAEELAAEARTQQIARIADIQYAILETSGRISFIPKRA
jgi:uncharacterized membrane protein YcaP (DUF421 family)